MAPSSQCGSASSPLRHRAPPRTIPCSRIGQPISTDSLWHPAGDEATCRCAGIGSRYNRESHHIRAISTPSPHRGYSLDIASCIRRIPLPLRHLHQNRPKRPTRRPFHHKFLNDRQLHNTGRSWHSPATVVSPNPADFNSLRWARPTPAYAHTPAILVPQERQLPSARLTAVTA